MTRPQPMDGRRLALATLVAAVVLLVAVLPAEYGLDPTGLGGRIGFLRLSGGAEGSDEAASAENNSDAAPPAIYAVDVKWRLRHVPLAEQSGSSRGPGVEQRVELPLKIPNLTALSARLEWDRQGTVGGTYMIEDKEMIAAGQLGTDRERIIARVRQNINAGARIVKVYTSTTPEQLKIVAEQAHERGIRVSGHIGISAREAALAGIDNLAHATGLPVPDLLKSEDLDRLAEMRVFDTERLRWSFPGSRNRGTGRESCGGPTRT